MRTGDILISHKGDDNIGYYYNFFEIVESKERMVVIIEIDKIVRPLEGYGNAGYVRIRPIPKRIGDKFIKRKIYYNSKTKNYYIQIGSARAYIWNGNDIILDKYRRS
jgi:hypothetical protein